MSEAGNHNATAVRKRTSSGDSIDTLVFLVPCLQFIRVQIIGVLNGSDLLLLAAFIVLASRGKIRIKTPVGKMFLILRFFLAGFTMCNGCHKAHGFCGLCARVEQYRDDPCQFRRDLDLAVWPTAAPGALRVGACVGNLLTIAINPGEFTADCPGNLGSLIH